MNCPQFFFKCRILFCAGNRKLCISVSRQCQCYGPVAGYKTVDACCSAYMLYFPEYHSFLWEPTPCLLCGSSGGGALSISYNPLCAKMANVPAMEAGGREKE
jgi:hypothetical protein